MTRINCVPVKELCNKMLLAEWREMPRLVSNLDKSLNRKSKPFDISEIPSEYTLGKGHVKYFYDKFLYLHKRHKQLTEELRFRGFNIKSYDDNHFLKVPKQFINDWTPNEKDIKLNRERIKIRMPNNPKWKLESVGKR